mgnify:CR=1 FL=1
MYIVGLTGGIGSGKTTVSQFFLNNNIEVINSDAISRDVVQPGTNALAKIEERFGAEILTGSKTLNRPRMRSIIFKDEDQNVEVEEMHLKPENKPSNKEVPWCDIKIVFLSRVTDSIAL